MDSFELNKIIGAILGTLLFIMGVGFLAEAIYHPIEGAGPGYALPGAVEGGGDQPTPPEVPKVSIGTLLASADPVAGAASAKKCTSCHDLSAANSNKTGPGLYEVVGRVIGSHPGFSYSAALAEHQAAGDTWTYEALNEWLISPKAFIPGNKMSFGGIKDDAERANIIAYLSTLAASPVPFPPADAAAAPADAAAAPAETAAPAQDSSSSSEAAPAQ
ncbi:MAG: cytochrome c family protein [Devosia sp.]